MKIKNNLATENIEHTEKSAYLSVISVARILEFK
jgi:hypothetical protein